MAMGGLCQILYDFLLVCFPSPTPHLMHVEWYHPSSLEFCGESIRVTFVNYLLQIQAFFCH